MARTASAQPIQVVETVPVFLTDRRVVASRSQGEVPAGFRKATTEEVALRYRHNAEFRQELYSKGAAWTADTGLETSGGQEISAEGKFSPHNNISSLPQGQRSFHYPGSGPVAVDVDFYGRDRRLGVVADHGSSVVARVAYVQDQAGSVAAAQNTELASLRRAEVGEGQKIVFTYPNGTKSWHQVPEGTTVHIE